MNDQIKYQYIITHLTKIRSLLNPKNIATDLTIADLTDEIEACIVLATIKQGVDKS